MPSRKSPCKPECHCQMWVMFWGSKMGMRAGASRGGVCPGAAAGFVHAIVITKGTRATFHPSHSKAVASCCAASVFLPLGSSHLPPHNPPHAVSLGCPRKDNRRASVHEIPIPPVPQDYSYTRGPASMCFCPPKAPRVPCPQQSHIPRSPSTS